MHFAHDNLEMWYGTPDAPAPDGTTEQRRGVSITVGVRPANPSNTVSVRYRVDGQGVVTAPARLEAHDLRGNTQYFRATFPVFWSGETVEYLPVVWCGGRRAPDPATASTFPSSFRLSTTSAFPPASRAPETDGAARAVFPARLEHLVHVTVLLAGEPEVIGETPAGFLVNWYPVSGALDGPAFHASVIPGGEHQTIVRPDGIGVLSASVSTRTRDGVLIALRHSGTVDYGEDWARRLGSGGWPSALPVRTHIRLLTSAVEYQWLNRLHCLSVGEVRPHADLYSYDMYAVR
ncbi:DUF3237 family protein [Geodermatophilus sabuli]|uniref:DUF3237 domain-containing protein n=1 Tax=Geodermatophilus sabuli TaxID=1564158 RepID=A0A285ECB9_9ACTN|nr:DUF3237 family protein [Geodermatophilus sabuli]MBB3084089.1 hypothetical protein [Geodermatophilus sabuli]SNX96637.1 Protein of unknown function [Geodermatophilus sabuli]